MRNTLKNTVVVITGASSGIGRATALAFAHKGAHVVLAARREKALSDLAKECEQHGVNALVVPTDMSNHLEVQQLADTTIQQFGHIDVWVNNHGVSLFALFEDAPLDAFHRVIETDFFGTVYGARAALPIFRTQGHGVLINLGSMLSKLSTPYASSYVASKHAIRGLGMSLRQELYLRNDKRIHVCTIMPATIDTPFFQHAANYTGRATKAMPPVYPAERVAKTIVKTAIKPRHEVFVGNIARLFWLRYLLAPVTTERQMAKTADALHLYKDKSQTPTSGNLFEPMQEGTEVRGGWQTLTGKQEHDTKQQQPIFTSAILSITALVPLLLALWVSKKKNHGKVL